jgi:glycosyltransferase involved in cell wall biosynthesis
MTKKIAVISDFDTNGSGYKYIAANLLSELSPYGYDIKVAGCYYRGEEYNYPFSVIPCGSPQDAVAIANNLHYLWQPDALLVLADIPLQLQIFQETQKFGKPYVAITPLENPPLTMIWAAGLIGMSSVFFISELGKQAALTAGVSSAEHLFVGIDHKVWKPRTPQDKPNLRKILGIDEDTFVILTVADNQERKNLWAGMNAVAKLKRDFPDKKIKYILVTTEQSVYGWKLRDLAVSEGISKEVQLYRRGMPTEDLWGLYAIADVYLQSSKAEGLGLPLLEAMSVGIPVVATNTGAMTELLADGRGTLVDVEYEFIDVWGNSKRSMIDTADCALALRDIMLYPQNHILEVNRALEYAKSRTWDIPARQLHKKFMEIFNEKE